jgi:hypothetical protein
MHGCASAPVGSSAEPVTDSPSTGTGPGDLPVTAGHPAPPRRLRAHGLRGPHAVRRSPERAPPGSH